MRRCEGIQDAIKSQMRAQRGTKRGRRLRFPVFSHVLTPHPPKKQQKQKQHIWKSWSYDCDCDSVSGTCNTCGCFGRNPKLHFNNGNVKWHDKAVLTHCATEVRTTPGSVPVLPHHNQSQHKKRCLYGASFSWMTVTKPASFHNDHFKQCLTRTV